MWLILNLSQENDKQLIALNDALDKLAQGDPRRAWRGAQLTRRSS
jgi:hypothetical protein